MPQELLLQELKEADQEVDVKATEYIEPGTKKGRGRSEDADIELKPAHNASRTSKEFSPVNP